MKKQRIISFLMSLLILFTSFPINVLADTEKDNTPIKITENGFVYKDANKDEIIGYTGIDKKINIPEGVKIIGEAAFKAKEIEEVYFPESILEIKDEAFTSNLITELNFNNSLEKVGKMAFANNKIESLSVSGEIKLNDIEEYAFQDNLFDELNLSWYKGKEIKRGVFKGNKIKELELGDNIKILREESFADNQISEIEFKGDTIEESALIGNDGYVIVKADSKEVKSGYVQYMYGHVINPVNIKVISLDKEDNTKVYPDIDIKFNKKKVNSYFVKDEDSKYISHNVDGYKATEEIINFVPDKDWYEVKVFYEKAPGPTLKQTHILRGKKEGHDVNEEELLYLVAAKSHDGKDIKDKVIVEPKKIENASEGIHEIIYVVEDEGSIATETLNIYIGEDPFKIQVGNSGWVLGDFLYYHEGMNEDGSFELGKKNYREIDKQFPLKRSNGKEHNYVLGFSEQGLKKYNAGLRQLELPHLNPYNMKNITGVGPIKSGTHYDKSFSRFKYTGRFKNHQTLEYIAQGTFTKAQFTGPFPNMPRLEYIGIEAFWESYSSKGTNVFSGNFPPLESIKIIETRAFGEALFTGELPEMPNLEIIGHNSFEKSKFHGDFPYLVNLRIVGNFPFDKSKFTGEFPPMLKLERIGKNAFKNSVFIGEFPNFPLLEVLDNDSFLNSNFTGEFPLLENIKLIEDGSFGRSIFTGEFPALPNVEYLGKTGTSQYTLSRGVFQSSKFTGEFPSMPNLKRIGALSFLNASFDTIAGSPNVTLISTSAFEYNKIGGSFPLFENLEKIDSRAFKESVFENEFPQMDKLSVIYHDVFYSSKFTGEFPVLESLVYLGNDTFYRSLFTGDFKEQPKLWYIGENTFRLSPFGGDFKTQPTLMEINRYAFKYSEFEGSFEGQPKLKFIETDAFMSSRFTGQFPSNDISFDALEGDIGSNAFHNSKFTGPFPDIKVGRVLREAFYKSEFTEEFPNLINIYDIGQRAFYHSKFKGEFPELQRLTAIEGGAFYNSEFEGRFPHFPRMITSTMSNIGYQSLLEYEGVFYNSNLDNDKDIIIGNKTSIFEPALSNKYGKRYNIRTANFKDKDAVNDNYSGIGHEQNPVYGDLRIYDKYRNRDLLNKKDVIFRNSSETTMDINTRMFSGYDLKTPYKKTSPLDNTWYQFPIEGDVYTKQNVEFGVDVADKDPENKYEIELEMHDLDKPITKAGQRVAGTVKFKYPDVNPLDESKTPFLNGFIGIHADRKVFSFVHVDLVKPIHRTYANPNGFHMALRPDLKPGETYEVNFELEVAEGFKQGFVSDDIILSLHGYQELGVVKSERFEYNVDSIPQLIKTDFIDGLSSGNVYYRTPWEENEKGEKLIYSDFDLNLKSNLIVDEEIRKKYGFEFDNFTNLKLNYNLNIDHPGRVSNTIELLENNGWTKVDNKNFSYNLSNIYEEIPPLKLNSKSDKKFILSKKGLDAGMSSKLEGNLTLTGNYGALPIKQTSKVSTTITMLATVPEVEPGKVEPPQLKPNPNVKPEGARLMRAMRPMSLRSSQENSLVGILRPDNPPGVVGYFGVEIESGQVLEDGSEFVSDINRLTVTPGSDYFHNVVIKNTMSSDKKNLEIIIPFGDVGDPKKTESRQFINHEKLPEYDNKDITISYLNIEKDINDIYENGRRNVVKTINEKYGDLWSDKPTENTRAIKIIVPLLKSKTSDTVKLHMITNPANENKDWFKETNVSSHYKHEDSYTESESTINHLFIVRENEKFVTAKFKVIDQHGNPVKNTHFNVFSDHREKVENLGKVFSHKVFHNTIYTDENGILEATISSDDSYKFIPANDLRPHYYHPVEGNAFYVMRSEIFDLEDAAIFEYEKEILQPRHEEYPVFFRNIEIYEKMEDINQYTLKNQDGKQIKTGAFQLINTETGEVVDGFDHFNLNLDQYNQYDLHYGSYELKQIEAPTDNGMPYKLNEESYFFTLGKYGDMQGHKNNLYEIEDRFIFYPNEIENQVSDINVQVKDFLTNESIEGITLRLQDSINANKYTDLVSDEKGQLTFKDVYGGAYYLQYIKDGKVVKHDTEPIVLSRTESQTLNIDFFINKVRLKFDVFEVIKRGLSVEDANNYAKLLSIRHEDRNYTVKPSKVGSFDVIRVWPEEKLLVNDKPLKLDNKGSTGEVQLEFVSEIRDESILHVEPLDMYKFYSDKIEIDLSKQVDLPGFNNYINIDVEVFPEISMLTLSPYNIGAGYSKHINYENFDKTYEYEINKLSPTMKEVYRSKDSLNKLNSIYYVDVNNEEDAAYVNMNNVNKEALNPIERTILVDFLKINNFNTKAIHLLNNTDNLNLKLVNKDGRTLTELQGGIFDVFVDGDLIEKDLEIGEDLIVEINNVPKGSKLTINQTKAPDGYRRNIRKLSVNIDELNDGDTLEFYNYKLNPVPKTGTTGKVLYLGLSMSLIILAFVFSKKD